MQTRQNLEHNSQAGEIAVQQFPCLSRSEMMRQLPRRPELMYLQLAKRKSERSRDVLAILLLMTGPVSSKYLMMGDIWRGAAILMVIQSSSRIRPGPVSNPVCHCHTAAVRPSDHCCTPPPKSPYWKTNTSNIFNGQYWWMEQKLGPNPCRRKGRSTLYHSALPPLFMERKCCLHDLRSL